MGIVREVLEKVFKVTNLAKDPAVVFAMDNDMWVPVRYLLDLEEFRLARATFEEVVEAALGLGFEYKEGLGVIRKKFSVPRTQVLIGGFSQVAEIKMALEKFDYISLVAIEDKDEFKLSCYCEEHAIEIALLLIKSGKIAVIESVDTYLTLYENALNYLNSFQLIPFFFEPVKKVFSFEEVKAAFLAHTVSMPASFGAKKVSVLASKAKKFLIFDKSY